MNGGGLEGGVNLPADSLPYVGLVSIDALAKTMCVTGTQRQYYLQSWSYEHVGFRCLVYGNYHVGGLDYSIDLRPLLEFQTLGGFLRDDGH